MTTIVLIHGRGQAGKDPDALKRKWLAGLNQGLTLAGRATLDPARLAFPFYGDVLETAKLRARSSGTRFELESASRLRDEHIDPLMPKEVAEVESDLLISMAEAAAAQTGTELLEQESLQEQILRIPGARRLAEFLAQHTDADQELIEGYLPDVAVYLRLAREPVLDVIRGTLAQIDGSLVIIAHSLGAAVARDLLDDSGLRERVDLLLTAGAPLGLQAVYHNLKAHGPVNPHVRNWVTVWDPDDFVALGHPLQRLYGKPLEDLRVDNPSGEAHSIERYLAHAPVAARIADALTV